MVKTIVEEIDPRGKVLSSRVHSVEEKSTKVNNVKSEQRVPSWAQKDAPKSKYQIKARFLNKSPHFSAFLPMNF